MPALLHPVDKGKAIVLDKPIVLVGRHPDCDAVILNSRKISRKHCAIALVNNHFVVRDLGSMNGIWVNGERVEQQAPLDFGDELTIGDVAFTLQADKAAEKAKLKPGAPTSASEATPAVPAKGKRSSAAGGSRKPLVKPLADPDASLDFPVPLKEEDDDGFNVPPPGDAAREGMRDTADSDEFIPLKDH